MPQTEPEQVIILTDRKSIEITGVTDVGSFDAESIRLKTTKGELVTTGKNIHITKLALEEGVVKATGDFKDFEFLKNKPKGEGLFQRLHMLQ